MNARTLLHALVACLLASPVIAAPADTTVLLHILDSRGTPVAAGTVFYERDGKAAQKKEFKDGKAKIEITGKDRFHLTIQGESGQFHAARLHSLSAQGKQHEITVELRRETEPDSWDTATKRWLIQRLKSAKDVGRGPFGQQ